MRFLLAGVSGFETQWVVRDAHGRHVLRADFCFLRERLVVETDGSRYPTDPVRDQATDNLLAELGWRILRFGWTAVVQDGREVVRQVLASLGVGHALHLGQQAAQACRLSRQAGRSGHEVEGCCPATPTSRCSSTRGARG